MIKYCTFLSKVWKLEAANNEVGSRRRRSGKCIAAHEYNPKEGWQSESRGRLQPNILCILLHIWVSFPRTGKMSVKRHIFLKSRRLVWLNQTILTASVDLWSLIMTLSF